MQTNKEKKAPPPPTPPHTRSASALLAGEGSMAASASPFPLKCDSPPPPGEGGGPHPCVFAALRRPPPDRVRGRLSLFGGGIAVARAEFNGSSVRRLNIGSLKRYTCLQRYPAIYSQTKGNLQVAAARVRKGIGMLSFIAAMISVLCGLPAFAQNTPTSSQGIGAASSSGIFFTGTQSTTSSSSTSSARTGPSFSTPRINIDVTLQGRVCDPLPDSEPSLRPEDHC